MLGPSLLPSERGRVQDPTLGIRLSESNGTCLCIHGCMFASEGGLDPLPQSQSGCGQSPPPTSSRRRLQEQARLLRSLSPCKDQAPARGPRGGKAPASSLPPSGTPGTETRGTDRLVLYRVQYSHSQLSTHSHTDCTQHCKQSHMVGK